MSVMQREIAEQPAALARLLARGRAAASEAAARIRAFAPAWVVIAARGSSDNAARYAKYVLGARNRLGVALAAPSLFTQYGAPPRLDRALAIGISQSGQSPDVAAVLAEARCQGGLTIAITNDIRSPLAAEADVCLALDCGQERAIAATKTYTSSLLAIAMLSAALDDADLAGVPDAVAAALAHEVAFPAGDRVAVVGRGYQYATAFELALKLEECAQVLAKAYSPADLLHGPIAMIGASFPVIVVPPVELDLAARGAHVIALPSPALPDWLAPIASIVPGQRLAHALAVARGLDPDHPRGLAKITRTR